MLSGQVIKGSLKFDGSYLSRTPGSTGNRRTYTLSAWVKRNKLGANQTIFEVDPSGTDTYTLVWFDSNDKLGIVEDQGSGNVYYPYTIGKFRDPSAWYHVVYAVDTTKSAERDRVKIYVNGVQQTLDSNFPSQNHDTYINTTNGHRIGYRGNNSSYIYAKSQFYLTQRLGPGFFGFTDPLTGTWRPKRLKQGDLTCK